MRKMIRNMNDDDLKPCPCCGGKAFFVVEPSAYSNSFFTLSPVMIVVLKRREHSEQKKQPQ